MRQTTVYMQRDPEKGLFWHDAAHPRICKMYRSDWPVFKVRVTERAEEGARYWAWWEEKEQEFCYVWPSKAQVDICFAYGAAAEQKSGRGMICAVDIEVVEEVK